MLTYVLPHDLQYILQVIRVTAGFGYTGRDASVGA